MKHNVYEIEKNMEKILRGEPTGFLTQNVSMELKKRLKKSSYYEYLPYPESEKVILYSKNIPNVKLFKIESYHELKHSSILGSLFALNITSEMFGDIVLYNGSFYIYLLDSISELVLEELVMVGQEVVHLIEVDLDTLSNYYKNYEKIEQIVSSLRLDTICSKLVGCNRDKIRDMLKDKDIIVNYECAKKADMTICEGDIFSIRRNGKYRFKEVIGKSKKGNYIISLEKYV